MGNAQTSGPGGYYSSLAREYGQIAKDAEVRALAEMDSPEWKKARKERLRETYCEVQALVPSAADLYS